MKLSQCDRFRLGPKPAYVVSVGAPASAILVQNAGQHDIVLYWYRGARPDHFDIDEAEAEPLLTLEPGETLTLPITLPHGNYPVRNHLFGSAPSGDSELHYYLP